MPKDYRLLPGRPYDSVEKPAQKYDSQGNLLRKPGLMERLRSWIAPLLIGAAVTGTVGGAGYIGYKLDNSPTYNLKINPNYDSISQFEVARDGLKDSLGNLTYEAPSRILISIDKNGIANYVDVPARNIKPYDAKQSLRKAIDALKEKSLVSKLSSEQADEIENLARDLQSAYDGIPNQKEKIPNGKYMEFYKNRFQSEKGTIQQAIERVTLHKQSLIDSGVDLYNNKSLEKTISGPATELVPVLLAGVIGLLLVSVNMTGFAIDETSKQIINVSGIGFFFIWILLLLTIVKRHSGKFH